MTIAALLVKKSSQLQRLRGILAPHVTTFFPCGILVGLPGDGDRDAPARSLQCDRASHGRMDLATVSRGYRGDPGYRFLLRDRDSVFSAEVDEQLKSFGLRVLRTPARAQQANAFCERLVGTVRRECLDFLVPLGEGHLRRVLCVWTTHYNQSRPHSSLGPGIPEPKEALSPPQPCVKHISTEGRSIVAKPILEGLHHEYRWERIAA